MSPLACGGSMPGDADDNWPSFLVGGRRLTSPERASNSPPPTPTAMPNAIIRRLPGCLIPYVIYRRLSVCGQWLAVRCLPVSGSDKDRCELDQLQEKTKN